MYSSNGGWKFTIKLDDDTVKADYLHESDNEIEVYSQAFSSFEHAKSETGAFEDYDDFPTLDNEEYIENFLDQINTALILLANNIDININTTDAINAIRTLNMSNLENLEIYINDEFYITNIYFNDDSFEIWICTDIIVPLYKIRVQYSIEFYDEDDYYINNSESEILIEKIN